MALTKLDLQSAKLEDEAQELDSPPSRPDCMSIQGPQLSHVPKLPYLLPSNSIVKCTIMDLLMLDHRLKCIAVDVDDRRVYNFLNHNNI